MANAVLNGKLATKKGRPAKGSLWDVQAKLWRGIERASELMEEDDPVTALKAMSALGTLAGSYLKLVNPVDTERNQERFGFNMD